MKILIISATLLIFHAFAFRQQSIGIRGQLKCGEKPLSGARIKVSNKNRIGTDDQLIDTKTNATGHFEAIGSIGSLFKIKPHLKIYHTCDYNINILGIPFQKPCSRKVRWMIPLQFVARSGKVQEFFDIGSVNMQIIFPDEERKCFV
uniref:Transthyretin-like family protein n=1 Tax=Elaeophora elaphi TaxID=1147741 RepID=A0A0R3S0R7_9BILA